MTAVSENGLDTRAGVCTEDDCGGEADYQSDLLVKCFNCEQPFCNGHIAYIDGVPYCGVCRVCPCGRKATMMDEAGEGLWCGVCRGGRVLLNAEGDPTCREHELSSPHEFNRDWFTHKCQCGREPNDPLHISTQRGGGESQCLKI